MITVFSRNGAHRPAAGGVMGVKALLLGVAFLLFTSSALAVESDENLTLNLKEADINSVIATVSEMTGKNFIVDPRVKGKVTVLSSKPMTRDEVYEVFLAVLRVNGFAAVPGKNVVKIVPEVNAKQDSIPTLSGRRRVEGEQFVTRIIPVQNAAAAQLVPILRPLLPQEGHLAAYPATNVLIAAASAGNVSRLVEIVRRIDLASDMEIELIPLSYASAEEVVRIVTSLERGEGATGKGAPPPATESAQIIADARTNSVLVGGDKSKRQQLKSIIKRLDTPTEATGNTRVIYLKYAKAADMVEVLSGVGQSIAEGEEGSAPKQTNRGRPVASRRNAGGAGSNFEIQADETTNALVINATPDVIRELEAVIRQLDIRRAQVLVKAVIAEISNDKANSLGIEWAYDGAGNDQPIGLINFGGAAEAISSLVYGNPPNLTNGVTLGVGVANGNDSAYGALIRALSGDTKSNVLSTPTLVTMDNEEAEIVVGQNVPFITGSYTSSNDSVSNPFQTIERQDVGLNLKIKPQINEGNVVKMEIEQEVSSVDQSASASDLITKKRSIKTTVMVDDGDILVLGGLMDEQLTESVQKVPLLGDIPLLGWLFSNQSTTKTKRNLMVFINPLILRDGKRGSEISSRKYDRIRTLQQEMRDDGVSLMLDDESPLLPELPEFLELPPSFDEVSSSAEPQYSEEPQPMAADISPPPVAAEGEGE